MTDDIRRRLACDRCHSQKLRCPRRPGEETCGRCRKARTSCKFSPFRQKKPPQEDQGFASDITTSQPIVNASQTECLEKNISSSSKRKRVTTHSEHIDIHPNLTLECASSALEQPGTDMLGVDWPSESLAQGQDFCANFSFEDFGTGTQTPSMPLDFDSFMPNSPQWQQPKQNGFNPLRQEPTPVLETSNLCMPHVPRPQLKSWDPLFPDTGRSRSANTFTPGTMSRLVRVLSDLSFRIYDHSTLMPPQSIHDPVPAGDMSSMQKYSKYSIDELFQLTQDLIDVYPSFLDALFGTHASSASTPSSMTDSSGVSNDTDTSTPPDPTSRAGTVRVPCGGSRTTSPDQSSILLILSVHSRLIGVYEELFKHMAVCMNHKGEMLTPGQMEVNLAAPNLRMGSYKPPPSSAIPMAMLLFVQFSSQLSNYATELATEIQESGASGPHSTGVKNDPNAISQAAAEDVKKRAKNMADELCRVRSLMLNSGLVA